MKIGDLIYIFYEFDCSKYIIKISEIKTGNRAYYHNFAVWGKVLWAKDNTSDFFIGYNSNSKHSDGWFAFKRYSVYKKDTKIKDILFIEEL